MLCTHHHSPTIIHLSSPITHLPSPTYDDERSHVFVFIVVKTVEEDENQASEKEESGGGDQEQYQLPQQEREEDRETANINQSHPHLSIILLFFAFKILMSCLLNRSQLNLSINIYFINVGLTPLTRSHYLNNRYLDFDLTLF